MPLLQQQVVVSIEDAMFGHLIPSKLLLQNDFFLREQKRLRVMANAFWLSRWCSKERKVFLQKICFFFAFPYFGEEGVTSLSDKPTNTHPIHSGTCRQTDTDTDTDRHTHARTDTHTQTHAHTHTDHFLAQISSGKFHFLGICTSGEIWNKLTHHERTIYHSLE